MKKIFFTLALATAMTTTLFGQEDAEGCKDPQLFPTRMPNFNISECQNNFDEVEFALAAEGTGIVTKEGTKKRTDYYFYSEDEKAKPPSGLQILRNYETAVKKIGGQTLFLKATEGRGVFKIVKPGTEVWVKIEINNEWTYFLTILEIEAMKQEVTADDILTALTTDGRIALYINFETGKSDIKAESQNTIDQIVEMLKANPSLKIHIEGHTDNVGAPASNQMLSENRAKAVMNAVGAEGVDKARLTSSGFGQTKPTADNSTEEGKAKNRRVEIVKL